MTVNTNVLDFYNIFVNEIVGNPILFVILTLALCAIFLVRMRAPPIVFVITISAIGFILSIFFEVIYIMLILFVFGFIGFMMSRLRRE